MKLEALLVGINEYSRSSGLTPLRYAEADAEALAHILEEQYGFRSTTLLGPDATQRAIQSAMLSSGKGETFLFFFAGHGQRIAGSYCLHPVDSIESGVGTIAFDAFARQWQSDFGYDKVLALVDACRSELRGFRGSSGLDAASSRDIRAATNGERWVEVLYGCSEGQVSYEDETLGHGVFSKALLGVLSDHKGPLDTDYLSGTASDWMRDWCRKSQRGWHQEAYRYHRPSFRNRIVLLPASVVSQKVLLENGKDSEPVLAANEGESNDGSALLPGPKESLIITEDRKSGARDLTIDIGGGVKMELVLIPAGEFMMGSNDGANDEKPVHKVKISKPFYMGKYQVTQKQYEKVMGTNPSHIKGAKNPVESVSWNDAQVFCERLSRETGYTIMLPKEAQWEYACRAGSTTRWHSGDNESQLGDYAWYGSTGDKTKPVGQKKPNAWGLYDMHGNVWEWCQDWYDSGYYENSPVSDPMGPTTGSSRVHRGGYWYNYAVSCRSAYRRWNDPDTRNFYIGFRVVAVRRDE